MQFIPLVPLHDNGPLFGGSPSATGYFQLLGQLLQIRAGTDKSLDQGNGFASTLFAVKAYFQRLLARIGSGLLLVAIRPQRKAGIGAVDKPVFVLWLLLVHRAYF